MQSSPILEDLSGLLSLEVEEAQACAAAVPLAGEGAGGDELARIGLEHQLHAVELHEAILRLGHSPPDVEPDVNGYVIGAITPPRRRPNPEQLLEAMRGNEQLANALHAKVLAKSLPDDLRAVIARHAAQEQQHLETIERTLSRRAWEGWAAGP